MAWDAATRDGGTWAAPGTAYYELLVRALPESYDRAPTVPPDTFTKAVCYAIGRELMRLRYTLDWLGRDGSAATVEDKIDEWERLLGLPVRPDLALGDRRDLVIERYSGRLVSAGEYLLRIATRELGVLPLVVVRGNTRIVYRYPTRGWQGQELVDAAEAHLWRSGSAGFGKWVLMWDDPMGLTGEQLDGLRGGALDEANAYFDLDGRPSSIDYLSSDALDTLSFDAIDALEA